MAFNENKPVHNSNLSSSEIRENFKHLKQAVSKEHAWNDSNSDSTSHRFDQMRASFGGSTQGATRSSGDFVFADKKTLNTLQTDPATGAGNYSLQEILQHLINCSHRHSQQTLTFNCNCNCNCNCGGNN